MVEDKQIVYAADMVWKSEACPGNVASASVQAAYGIVS